MGWEYQMYRWLLVTVIARLLLWPSRNALLAVQERTKVPHLRHCSVAVCVPGPSSIIAVPDSCRAAVPADPSGAACDPEPR